MKRRETNIVEVQRSTPKRNTARYKAIAPEHLSSVSGFRAASIVDSRLGSISKPKYVQKEIAKAAEYYLY
ncbi:MAG: hypothetical protein ACE14S_10185 [Candidatus Bathyarchaeia archaeon]